MNLSEFLSRKGLSVKEVAAQLFPGNKYPDMALSRVLRGESKLDVDQLGKLAAMAGTSVLDVLKGSGDWTSILEQDRFTFTSGEYRAVLDRTKWMTYIYHNGSLFHEEHLLSPSITLKDYLAQIDLVVAKKEFS